MKTLKFNLSRMMILGILLIVAVFMTMGDRAQAFEWFTANQYTIAWDAVTNKADGEPIPATDTILYVVYTTNIDLDADKTSPYEQWRGPELVATVTFAGEGIYWVGVKAIRIIEDGTEAGESVINWSDNSLATGEGNEFGMRYFLGPASVTGLRPEKKP